MSTPAEKAAERKAKLAAKAEARLAKITGAAQAEGRVISPSIETSSKPATSSEKASIADFSDDPAEVDLSSMPRYNPPSSTIRSRAAQIGSNPAAATPFNPGAGPFGAFGAQGDGSDPMSAMFAQLMAGLNGSNPNPGEEGLSNISFPLAGDANAPPLVQVQRQTTRLERLFPYIHFFSNLLLFVFAAFWYEPIVRGQAMHGYGAYYIDTEGVEIQVPTPELVHWNGWGQLLWSANRVLPTGLGSIATVPFWWMFLTLQLVLQATRLMLLPPAPLPAFLNPFLPIISNFPPVSRLLFNLNKYYSIVNSLLDDLSVVFVSFATMILIGAWKNGQLAPPFGIPGEVVDVSFPKLEL